MPDSVSASWWKVVDGGIEFSVRVTPNARRSAVAGVEAGVVRAKVAAPPEGGRANVELCRLVAEWFGVREQKVQILSGMASRAKRVRVEGASHPPRT